MGPNDKPVVEASFKDLRGSGGRKLASPVLKQPAARAEILTEEVFQRMLTLERRRAERSRKPFVLMLLDADRESGSSEQVLRRVLAVVGAASRQTDLIGWYKKSIVVGVIFTELGNNDIGNVAEALRAKIQSCVRSAVGNELAAKVTISLHLFPENWNRDHASWVADSKLYPDLEPRVPLKKWPLRAKRVMDVAVSLPLLLILSPLLVTIAMLIKLTSKGPVLFEQERLGKLGQRFRCLKFRTMRLNCGHKIHEEYVQRFIAGKVEGLGADSNAAVYKITKDPRVTRVGQFLRKTSLDELPQLCNVLVGEMSLVGPRPPLPYEFEVYDLWHRRRVLELKPGITGLWQVSGRSTTRFDDMVRLDLNYAQSWSLWLDLKILLATPRAVVRCEGAY